MIERLDTIVIGGGQAGLAMGHALSTRGRDYAILDASPRSGDAWRNRWDSLHLFTPRRYSSLPGFPLSGDPNGYPTKNETADYLESYAAHFALPVRLATEVQSLERAGDYFRITTATGSTIEVRFVVIATGAFQVPKIPAIGAMFSGTVCQLSAASYRNPSEVPAGTVLVVGDGATGRQIACELADTHPVLLAVGRTRRISPDRVLGRSIFWWLDHLGVLDASRETRVGRRLMARDPFPGRHLDLPRLLEAGVAVVPRLTGIEGTTARFADGQSAAISTVVWASGYRDDLDWVHIPAVKGADGTFVQTRGISPVPGLYFVGRSWQWTRGSALLLGVGKDAAYVAGHMQQSERAIPQHARVENPLSAAVGGTGSDRESDQA